MAVPFLKFLPQRLNSLLLQETETFCGLEDQIERLTNTLREIGWFSDDICSTKSGDPICSWANELRDLINDIDDQIDEFIIQMDLQQGSDRLAWTDRFRNELQKLESRLAQIVLRMTEHKNSSSTGGKKADEEEKSHQVEDQRSVIKISTTIDGEKENEKDMNQAPEVESSSDIEEDKEDKEEKSHDMEVGQTSARKGSSITGGEKEDDKKIEGGQVSQSTSFPFITNFSNLPYFLQYSLLYCCVFPENYWICKGKLVRLLVAEGLIQEKPGKMMEDLVEENINELISKGMLLVKDERPGNGTKLTVAPPYRDISLCKTGDEIFIAPLINSGSSIPHNAYRAFTSNLRTTVPKLNNLRTRSLLLFKNQDLSEDNGNWLNFHGAKFLRVLDLEGTKIKSLPDQVGDLVHLAYLSLKQTDINELPARLGNLRLLQTLDIRWCGKLTAVPIEVLNLVRLRHLKMYKNINVSGMELPTGIGRLRNFLTLTGIHAGAGIAEELGNLIQLRRLGVMDLAEENVTKLFASIMKMQDLLCLSLEVNHCFKQGTLFLSESFSPPPLLRKLRLEGLLRKIPSWLGSMERLTNIRLGFSHLSENPMSVLQLLPNLKKLTLWQAYDAKQLGKEFCRAGGFLKLEVLSIASHVLEEWSEIEEGALPSLEYLHFHNCCRLRMLPEGLQFVTTLKKLDLWPLLDDHMERLKPDGGEENYKIRHIPCITLFPVSVLQNKFGQFMSSA